MKNIAAFVLAILFGLTTISCNKEKKIEKEQLEKDITIIEQYLKDNNLTATKTDSGLHYIITKTGNGSYPSVSSTVDVDYKGYFTNKEVFDETPAQRVSSFALTSVIKGWQEGIPKLSPGGKGVLLIPSKLGYGDNPPSGIPANSVLIFDVELLGFR